MSTEKGMGPRRITLSTEASDTLRSFVDRLLEDGLKNFSERLQSALRSGAAKGPMDPSNVARVLILAGAAHYDLIKPEEVFSSDAEADGEEEGK
jgi:hypothetical protein